MNKQSGGRRTETELLQHSPYEDFENMYAYLDLSLHKIICFSELALQNRFSLILEIEI